MKTIWLLCGVYWDYDRHSNPIKAFSSKEFAQEALERTGEIYDPDSEDRERRREGYEIIEVDWIG